MPNLSIEGWPNAIPTGRRKLLDAALAAGVPAPHQCRAGECGTCKCRLLQGEVEQGGNLPTALSDEEKAAGWILPCRCVAKSDVSIAYAAPLRGALPRRQSCRGRVSICEPASREVVRLVVELDKPLDFLAGQYVALSFPGFPERNFSPANAPGAKFLEFYVRVLPEGLVSQHIARHVVRGDPAKIVGPFGEAHLSSRPAGPILAAGGGTGLAPMLSILRYLASAAPKTQIDLYFGVRTTADLFAGDTLAALSDGLPGLRAMTVLSDEAPPGYRRGFIAPAILSTHGDLSRHQVFAAGPPPMVETIREAALQLGAERQSIHADPFVANGPVGDVVGDAEGGANGTTGFGRWLTFGRR